jgi:hypothetical protein
LAALNKSKDSEIASYAESLIQKKKKNFRAKNLKPFTKEKNLASFEIYHFLN